MKELSLYKRIGGEDAVTATVTKLYGKILTDSLLIPFFNPTKVEQLKRSQIAFITMAFGGAHNYTGDSLRKAHASLVINKGLSDIHFDAVAEHLKSSMEELNVPNDLINEALSVVETTRSDVLNK